MRLGPLLRGVVAMTALAGALAACRSEAEEGSLTQPSGEENASASATPAESPPEVPPATDDEKGRRAFAEWFVAVLAYANRTNEGSPILERAIEDPELSCSGLRGLRVLPRLA